MLVAFLGLGILSGGLMIAAFAGAEQPASPTAGSGGCAAYSGLPDGHEKTAGMVFIPGGTFAMGSSAISRRNVLSIRSR